MLSLRNLILSDLQCFDLNLLDDEIHNDEKESVQIEKPQVNDLQIEEKQLRDDDEFYLMIEQRKANLNERLSQEIQSSKCDQVQVKTVQEEKPRERYTKKVSNVNLTEQWVFHPAFNRYEKIEKELCKNLRSSTHFKIPLDDQLDRVRDFMVSMVEVDHLRSQLEQDKDIQIGALWHHFTQWLVRLSHKHGKDALYREKEGSRTQAQIAKRNLGIEQVFEAPVVARQVKNDEGQVLDMFDEHQIDDFDLTIREKQLNQKVLECLKAKFPEEYEFYNQLYLDKLYEKYPSVTAWSKAIDMPERKLRCHLEKMTRKLQSFGRDLFLS